MYDAGVSDQQDDARRSRATARGSWPVRRFHLGAEPPDDLSDSTTAEQRLAMMWPLAVEAWLLAGRPLPDYPRSRAPIRRFRRELP